MAEVLWLAVLLGVGAAFSVGPIFVTIIHEAATRGFGSAFRVILGSATADAILLVPALAFTWLISSVIDAALWVSIFGAVFFLYLGQDAVRSAWRLWHARGAAIQPQGWAFWKGVVGNLANPLTWTFWLATGTPTLLRAYHVGGWSGLILFNIIWFVVASGMEAVIALGVARSRQLIGARGQAAFTGLSAVMFLGLAGMMLTTNILPVLAAP